MLQIEALRKGYLAAFLNKLLDLALLNIEDQEGLASKAEAAYKQRVGADSTAVEGFFRDTILNTLAAVDKDLTDVRCLVLHRMHSLTLDTVLIKVDQCHK